MSNAAVLCAEANLNNPVEGVGFIESESSDLTMLKNTLVLSDVSTFAHLPRTEALHLLETYRNLRVPAVVLKSSSTTSVSGELVSLAEAYGVPILLLPKDTIISSVIRGINYEILRSNSYNLARSYEDNFFQEMIFTERDPQMMQKRARMMGIRINELLCAILIHPPEETDLFSFTQECREAWSAPSFLTSRNGIIMLIGRVTMPYSSANAAFCEMSGNLLDALVKRHPEMKLSVGVGHCFENIANLRKSYYSAKTALVAALSNVLKSNIVFYDQLGIYKVLFDVKNRESIQEIRDETATRIHAYDEAHQTDFYNTISTYLCTFGSIQDTALKMAVHYNTIRYRISKIGEVFGWDLFDSETCILLAIGFRIDQFLRDEDTF